MDQPLAPLSLIGFLMTPSGIVMLALVLIAIGLIGYFVPGGMKKLISIVLVVATFGVGLFLLKGRKNKLIERYNEDLRKYQDLLADKEKNDAKVRRLTSENERLEQQEEIATEEMETHYDNYLEAKKQTARLDAERGALAARIDARAETLDDGYEFGTAARFRSQWEAAKSSAHSAIETPAPRPVVAVAGATAAVPIDDPTPMNGAVVIDVSLGPYRLKGDVS